MDRGGALNWRVPTVAAVGCGQWGKNIARNLSSLGALHAVCDSNPAAARKLSAEYGVPARSLPEVLNDNTCEAIALASPAALHTEHARHALKAGKHVFVEKPLALNMVDGCELARLARKRSRVLMVGHLLRYHPHVLKLISLVRDGELGHIRRIFARRQGPGRLRSEEDVMWSFAPHDISLILALVGEQPKRVWAEGSAILQPSVLDMATVHMKFPNAVAARVHVSWLNPYKEQKLTVVGSKATALFDDRAEWADKLLVYEHNVLYRDGRPWTLKTEPVRYRIDHREPLREECAHFLESVSAGTVPRTDSVEGLAVLSVLEAATRSLDSGRHVKPKCPRLSKAPIRQGATTRKVPFPALVALDG
ncbi:MAG TPA: Gfo/Idh/MocA family oxidoreductase [Rhizomicrobium sp.]|jgi:predicted dehydrogenase